MKTLLFTFIFIIYVLSSFAQKVDSTFSTMDIVKFVHLDSMTVVASKSGFSIEEFIDLVMQDTSFAQAFHNMRSTSFFADNSFEFYDAKNLETIASSEWNETQHFDNKCRWSITSDVDSEGKFYKLNKAHRFYTSSLFSSAFYSAEKICNENPGAYVDIESLSGMAKRKEQLKRAIFNPGQPIEDVPLISKRMAIFSEKMMPKYDYSISNQFTEDSIECYVFSVQEKQDIRKIQKGTVVLKYMESWFDKSNFQIISRSYHLENKSAIYDFDVKMDVSLQKINDSYFLEQIIYDGFWDIPFKPEERCKAIIDFLISDVH